MGITARQGPDNFESDLNPILNGVRHSHVMHGALHLKPPCLPTFGFQSKTLKKERVSHGRRADALHRSLGQLLQNFGLRR